MGYNDNDIYEINNQQMLYLLPLWWEWWWYKQPTDSTDVWCLGVPENRGFAPHMAISEEEHGDQACDSGAPFIPTNPHETSPLYMKT